MRNKLIGLFLTTLCLSLFIGCGAERTQVSGKVAFEDGSPVTKGQVKARTAEGLEVMGPIKSDGTYLLSEVKIGDGVPSGKAYKVWVANAVDKKPLPPGRLEENPEDFVPLVHKDFTNPNTSPLTLDVQGAKQTFDITVKKP